MGAAEKHRLDEETRRRRQEAQKLLGKMLTPPGTPRRRSKNRAAGDATSNGADGDIAQDVARVSAGADAGTRDAAIKEAQRHLQMMVTPPGTPRANNDAANAGPAD